MTHIASLWRVFSLLRSKFCSSKAFTATAHPSKLPFIYSIYLQHTLPRKITRLSDTILQCRAFIIYFDYVNRISFMCLTSFQSVLSYNEVFVYTFDDVRMYFCTRYFDIECKFLTLISKKFISLTSLLFDAMIDNKTNPSL